MRYPVGTQYTDRHGRVNTVVDYLTTTNLAGSVVRQRYVVERRVAGSIVTDYDVVETSIRIALNDPA